jgi:hypothetical protein
VLHDAQNTFDKVAKDIEKAAQEALTTALQPIRDQEVREEIQDAFKGSFDTFKSRYAALRRSHILDLKEARTKDPVRDELDRLLRGSRLGKKPSAKKLEERREEAQTRIDHARPPGHADAKNKPDACGDYLIWAELLDHAKKADRPILFVTNDSKKGDWFLNIHNRTMGPLPELVAEMAEVLPNHRYHQVGLGSLLELTNKHLDTSVSEGTIDTVRVLKHDQDDQWIKLARQTERLKREKTRSALAEFLIEGVAKGDYTQSSGGLSRLVLSYLDNEGKGVSAAEIIAAAEYIDSASQADTQQPESPQLDHD